MEIWKPITKQTIPSAKDYGDMTLLVLNTPEGVTYFEPYYDYHEGADGWYRSDVFEADFWLHTDYQFTSAETYVIFDR